MSERTASAVPLALALALVFASAITALYGWTVERIAYRPLRRSFRLAPLISAIGMSIVLQNYVQIVQGARVKPLPPLIHVQDDAGSSLANLIVLVALPVGDRAGDRVDYA